MTNKPMLSVELQMTERQECDLMRFYDTCEDSQPYDVPKDRMKSLARLGLVRSLGFSRYEFTDIGCAAVEKLRAFLDMQSCGACGGCHNGCKLDRESPPIEPAAQHQGEPVAQSEFEPDAICLESDGCPTEGAVLKRFWRENQPDTELCKFYEAEDCQSLVKELVGHVAQLQDAAKRNVKPWEDTFPPTLLPAYIARINAEQPAPVAVVMPEIFHQTIRDTLRNYRMSTLDDGHGGGYPLIDAMTADGQPVSGGIEECQYLADAILNDCIDEVSRLNGVKP